MLDVLERHAGEPIRVAGSLHSWSACAATTGVALDLRQLRQVTVLGGSEAPSAELGAGCRIERVVRELRRQGDWALPTMGLIDAQTIAGATATGTHGSGRPSLSHFIRAARVCAYDPRDGHARIHTITAGSELEAVRCSLGCLGVITSMTVEIRPQYRIEEHFRVYRELDPVLEAEAEYPLQQFYLIPWRWEYLAQHRRETQAPRSRSAPLYRLYWAAGLDLGFHLALRGLVRAGDYTGAQKGLYRSVVPHIVPRSWTVVDRADRQLTMNHDLFRHIEIELFVVGAHLRSALAYLESLLRFLAGDGKLTDQAAQVLEESGLLSRAEALADSYTHHYPICVRKVEPERTLISMGAGFDGPRYAVSVISYAHPARREPFLRVAEVLAGSMGHAFAARPHWGKLCPLGPGQADRLYPRLPQFRDLCRANDPSGRFRVGWAERILGFDGSTPAS